MLILVSDASVLIDIEYGRLTHAMFSLPYQFLIPDVLFVEELEEQHAHLLDLGLISRSLTSELMIEAFTLRQPNPKVSVNDLLALVLAKQKSALLLTGDKALRALSETFQIEVHGTLWLVQKCWNTKKLIFKPQK